MRHEDWRDREADRLRRLRDRERGSELEDYGQADYSDLYGYDPRTRTGYRTFASAQRGVAQLRPARDPPG